MNQFVCENPQRIVNPYTGDTLYVPCGKCDMCRSSRSAHWTERLEFERSCHPFCVFGTLTYSDEFLPCFSLINDGLLNDNTGELIPFEDLKDFLDYDSFDFIRSRGCLPVGDVQDVQRFIKRIRSRISSNPTDEPKECRYFRYFLVCELGETTFRPHYHFLGFTASRWFAEHAQGVVSECWSTDNRYSDSKQLGITDVQHVQTSASSYVSSYVNSFIDCPKVYHFKRFKPFKIFSKNPPLGSLLPQSKEIQALFDSGAVKMSVYRRKSNEFVEVPLSESLRSRLYPKVTGYSRLSVDVLTGLYNLEFDFSQGTFKDFKDFVRFRWSKLDTGIGRYFQRLLSECTESESNILNVFSCLRRIFFQCHIFGVSRYQYSQKIIAFYKSRDYELLRSFYDYYSDRSIDCKEMLLCDVDKYSSLCSLVNRFIDYRVKYNFSTSFLLEFIKPTIDFCKTYGYDEDSLSLSDWLYSLSQENDLNFVSSRSVAKKIVNDSRKKKAKNEYLETCNLTFNFRNYLNKKHGLSKYNERVAQPNS